MVCSRTAAGTAVIRSPSEAPPLEDAIPVEQRAPERPGFAALCHFRPVLSRFYNVLRASRERHRPLLGGRPEEIRTRRTWDGSWLHAGGGDGNFARRGYAGSCRHRAAVV